ALISRRGSRPSPAIGLMHRILASGDASRLPQRGTGRRNALYKPQWWADHCERSGADRPREAGRRRGLRGARARIPRHRDTHRLAITCRYLLELSEEETAAALGCRRGTVKSRLARALERLRAELGEEA